MTWLEQRAQREAQAEIDHARSHWPFFEALRPEIYRLMVAHRWLTMPQAYELACLAYCERAR